MLSVLSKFLVAAFFLLGTVCSPAAPACAQDIPLEVFVSIAPHAGFVKEIGGEHVNVSILIGKGQEPHSFEPMPKQVVALSKSNIYFLAGLPFENFLIKKIGGTTEDVMLFPLNRGIDLSQKNHTQHDHDEDKKEDADLHTWLSPPLIKVQAANILNGLISVDPKHAEEYRTNFSRFINTIDRAEQEIKLLLAPIAGETFYVFHPAFDYFATNYGLTQKAVEMGGKAPSPRHLAHLIERARKEKVRIIFVQPQFDQRSAQKIADAIGGVVVSIDPLAHDIMSELMKMAQTFATAARNAASQ